MNDCRKSHEYMPRALYGELTESQKGEFEAHLGVCPSCAAEYERLEMALKVMDERCRPEPGPEFWEAYWAKLATRIEKEEHRLTGNLISLPKWATRMAAAMLLIVLGVFIGRMLFRAPGLDTQIAGQALPAPIGKQAADILRAQNYFERSKVVLLALVNFDPKTKDSYGLNFPEQKKVSKDLVREAAYLKGQFKSPAQKRLKALVSELEMILIQIANLDEHQEIAGVELVKRGLDESAILFKINLSEMWRDARANKNENPHI